MPNFHKKSLAAASLHTALFAGAVANAALPLNVDDAGTVPRGEAEVFLFYEIESASSERVHAFPIEVTVGLHDRADFTIAAGYQFLDGERNADSWLDTTAAAKFGVWSQGPLELSLEGFVAFPTSSERKGFGDGGTNGGFNLALTRTGERTSLDLNAGCLFAGSSEDDLFSAGLALRREAAQDLLLFAEALMDVSLNSEQTTTVTTRVGSVWEFRENWNLGGGIGPSFGTGSPDFTGVLGVTAAF